MKNNLIAAIALPAFRSERPQLPDVYVFGPLKHYVKEAVMRMSLRNEIQASL